MNLLNLLAVLAAAVTVQADDVDLLTDIRQISRYWGQISTYADNPEDYFGVEYVGLPSGCQIVSAPRAALWQPLAEAFRNLPTPSNGMHNDFRPVAMTMVGTTCVLQQSCQTLPPQTRMALSLVRSPS